MKEFTLDCAAIQSREAFHRALADVLSFPVWYGKNLDALHDCLTAICEETHLHLLHWDALEAALPPFAAGAKKAILHAAAVNPYLSISLE